MGNLLLLNTASSRSTGGLPQPAISEHGFLKGCIDLCISRMQAEKIDDRGYTVIRIPCVTAGVVFCSFINEQSHTGILFHVHYEGNQINGIPLYAVSIRCDAEGEYIANTVSQALTPIFEVI